VNESDTLYSHRGHALRLIFPNIDMTEPFYSRLDPRVGNLRHSQADIGKARGLLGYAPTHRLADGVAEAMPWYVASMGAAGK
jgi:UDP-N-acetylglucosamine 4-epimerase